MVSSPRALKRRIFIIFIIPRNGGTYMSLANPDLKPEKSESFELGLRANGRVGELELSSILIIATMTLLIIKD